MAASQLETIYTRKRSGLIKGRHSSKWRVKQLTGANNGACTLFNSAESARAECFYMADCCGICCALYAPLFEG